MDCRDKDTIKLLQEIKSVYFDKQSDYEDEGSLIDEAIQALEERVKRTIKNSRSDKQFLLFYKSLKNGFLGHVWVYGEDELRIEINSTSDEYEILQVIEVFGYKEIDIDGYE